MKKNGKRFISLLCGMVLLLSPMAVRAAEAPYQTYTIDKWGNATPAPDGYLPTRSIGAHSLGWVISRTPPTCFTVRSMASSILWIPETGGCGA